jgi:hypothetical protein
MASTTIVVIRQKVRQAPITIELEAIEYDIVLVLLSQGLMRRVDGKDAIFPAPSRNFGATRHGQA